MRSARGLALAAVLLLGWLLLSVPGGLTGLDALAGAGALAAGLLAGAAWPGAHDAAARVVALADDLLGEGASGHERGADGRPAGDGEEGDPERLDPAEAPAAVDAILDRLGDWLGVDRLLVWRVDPDVDRVAVEHGTGPLPPPTAVAGSPLAWALMERSTVRLDPVPRWARGSAVVAPVDDRRVLTVEAPPAHAPGPAALQRAAAILAPFLRLHDRQADAAAAVHRLDQVIAFLGSVPREADPARMPAATAEAAMAIADGSGAIVASWDEQEGRGEVLIREGSGGGPGAGRTFGTADGDLAHAARTRAPVARGPGDGRWPALASDGERWQRPPPAYRVVIPLVDPRGRPTGLLAVWARTALAVQGVALLEAIAPLLALQLSQAGDLAHYRDQATLDTLTGLPNRAALDDHMAEERARFHRYRRPVAVLVVDLDHFKLINDTHGHDAGDAVLRQVADLLRSAVREVDFAARFGGEELVVVLPETLLSQATEVAERVRTAVDSAQVEIEGVHVPVTASIGVSACPECVEDPVELFASADAALYAAKEAGRNRVTTARELTTT